MGKIERFSASAAAKHLACHASANLEAAIPGFDIDALPKDTAASSKGTDMHHILELSGEYSAKEQLALAEAMVYVAQLRQTRRFKQLLEADGTGWWLTGTPNTKADVVLYVADEIHVIDYKFGRIPVQAFDNSQGKYYAAAFQPLAPKAKGVTFHIVQPLAQNIDSVFFTKDELAQFRVETAAADAAIQAGDVSFGPSDACMFCPANPHGRGVKGKPYCPALMNLYYPIKLDEDALLDDTD